MGWWDRMGLTSNSVFAPALKWVLNASWLPGFFSTKMPSAKYSVLSFVICGFKKDKKYIPMDAVYFKTISGRHLII